MRRFTEFSTSLWLLRSARAMLVAVACLAGLWSGDAVTVNPDGSVVFGADPGGSELLRAACLIKAPNVLSGQTPVAVTGAVTLTTTAFGQWHLVSGVSTDYAITLPTVVGNTGRCIGIRVQDTAAASKTYTLTPASGQKIDGQTTVAMTANQAVVLMSDGIQWARIAGQPGSSSGGGSGIAALGDWQDGGPVVIEATTSAPVKGTTVDDHIWWRRVGDSAEFRMIYRQSAGGSAGSGVYLFKLPAGLVIDVSKTPFSGADGPAAPIAGTGKAWTNNATGVWEGAAQIHDPTHIHLYLLAQNSPISFIGSTVVPMTGWAYYVAEFRVPIAGWSGTQVVQNGSRYLWTQRNGAGTRVTVTPTQSGQWRSYRKSANSQAGVDGAPLALPSAADGFRITSANHATAATDATRYEIYVGSNKVVAWEFAASAGRTGYLMADRAEYGSTFGSTWGMDRGYDRNTGIAWIDTQIQDSTVTGRYCGNALPLGGGAATSVTTAYFDLLVADDPVPVAQDLPAGATAVKAFVRFNGANGAITSSMGVASVVRNSVGYYTVSLNAGVVPDGNYAVIANASHASGISWSVSAALIPGTTPSSSSFIVGTGYGSTPYDPQYVNVMILR